MWKSVSYQPRKLPHTSGWLWIKQFFKFFRAIEVKDSHSLSIQMLTPLVTLQNFERSRRQDLLLFSPDTYHMSLLWISLVFEGWISSLLQDFNLIGQEKTDESNRRAGCSGLEGRNFAQPLPYFRLEWPCKARRGNKAVFGMLIFGYRARKWACSNWSVVGVTWYKSQSQFIDTSKYGMRGTSAYFSFIYLLPSSESQMIRWLMPSGNGVLFWPFRNRGANRAVLQACSLVGSGYPNMEGTRLW